MADLGSRRLAVISALADELQRQGVTAVDLEALATAVDTALGRWTPPDVDDLSKEPDELNATNDG